MPSATASGYRSRSAAVPVALPVDGGHGEDGSGHRAGQRRLAARRTAPDPTGTGPGRTRVRPVAGNRPAVPAPRSAAMRPGRQRRGTRPDPPVEPARRSPRSVPLGTRASASNRAVPAAAMAGPTPTTRTSTVPALGQPRHDRVPLRLHRSDDQQPAHSSSSPRGGVAGRPVQVVGRLVVLGLVPGQHLGGLRRSVRPARARRRPRSGRVVLAPRGAQPGAPGPARPLRSASAAPRFRPARPGRAGPSPRSRSLRSAPTRSTARAANRAVRTAAMAMPSRPPNGISPIAPPNTQAIMRIVSEWAKALARTCSGTRSWMVASTAQLGQARGDRRDQAEQRRP